MKKFFNSIKAYNQFIFLALYLIIVSAIWSYRNVVYMAIPTFYQEAILNHWLLDMILFSFTLTGFVCFLQILRCSPFEKQRFQKAFEEIGLQNCKGKYPILLSKKRDCNKKHGRIYKLNDVGISAEDFDKQVLHIKGALSLHIYRIEYGKGAKTINLYAIPLKHTKPSIISLEDKSYANMLCKLPNMLNIGQTGSGKSTWLTMLMGIYAKYIPNVSITVSDYKNSLVSSLRDTQNYYGYDRAVEGITVFYQEFTKRLAANDSELNKQIKVLVIDEYSALIGAQDKKKAEEIKTMVGNMLCLSRSLGIKIVTGMQTAHADNFKTGARDQFHAILALGNLSKEQKQMLFSDYKEKMNKQNEVGEGYLLINGNDIERVKIAQVKNIELLIELIRPTMNR